MCQYHSWARDEADNFVIECTRCHKIQVAFGMFMASFSDNEFHAFRNDIRNKTGQLHPVEHTSDKTIVLKTPCDSLKLLFSYDELQQLHRLLDEADTEMKTQQMLQLFDIPNEQSGV
jgi:hypothetical protein